MVTKTAAINKWAMSVSNFSRYLTTSSRDSKKKTEIRYSLRTLKGVRPVPGRKQSGKTSQ